MFWIMEIMCFCVRGVGRCEESESREFDGSGVEGFGGLSVLLVAFSVGSRMLKCDCWFVIHHQIHTEDEKT